MEIEKKIQKFTEDSGFEPRPACIFTVLNLILEQLPYLLCANILKTFCKN